LDDLDICIVKVGKCYCQWTVHW